MPILKYKKTRDTYTTYILVEPDHEFEDEESRVTTLGVLDGWTYAHVPDTLTLPEQPKVIEAQEVKLDAETKEALKAVSPIVQAIKGNVVEQIRAEYSINDEFKMMRLAPSPESEAYNDYVEKCRQWGHDRLRELGL